MNFSHRTLAVVAFLLASFQHSDITWAQVRVEAAAGQPFGVARVTVPLRPGADRRTVETNGYSIRSAENRVFYPAFSSLKIVGMLRQLINPDAEASPRNITAWFLFRGDTPFDISIHGPEEYRVRVRPNFQIRRHNRLMRNWWRQYTAMARTQMRNGDYPPLVETYLTAMLAQRLGLDFGELPDAAKTKDLGSDLLGLAFNLEGHRINALRDKMLSPVVSQERKYNLPSEITWPKLNPTLEAEDVEVEPIAKQVPEECFYIRFGNFPNYLWLKNFIETNGGDLAQMVTLRGHRTDSGQKLQTQLGLKESALGKILGGQVIADIALLGRDTYLQEGAAMGVLFEAKNNLLLGNDLMKQRRNAMKTFADSGAKIEKVTIGDTQVSFASTADNRLRSFYVTHDRFHLVTNSRHIVKQFLLTATGKHPSLADSERFRQMRREFPLTRDDTIFVHISTAFFRGLLDWNYQIELRRRLDSNASHQLATMARWAATNEGRTSSEIPGLIQAGLLPQHFPTKGHQLQGDIWVDPLRGARGTYLPIPDTSIEKITARELETLQRIRQWQTAHWPDMDPITLALKRFDVPDTDRERIRISARLLPFDLKKYGKVMSVVGPPTDTLIQTSPDDIIRLQMSLQGGRLLPSSAPHTMFFGMRDANVPADFGRSTFIRTLQILRTAPAYLGAWPKPGLLDRFPLGRRFGQDINGITRYPLGLWRWAQHGFSVLSFDYRLLLDTIPNLNVGTADDVAQIRLFVGDIANSKIHSWFHALNYHRALETSIGNTRLLHHLTQQLNLPHEDSQKAVEDLLAITMNCALGGTYELIETNGRKYWQSTKWPTPERAGEFTSRLATWFRGIELRTVMLDNRVVADALLDVKKTPQAGLPFFNLNAHPFPGKSKTKRKADSNEPPPEPLPAPLIESS